MKIIKVGFLASYDYRFLMISMPKVYPYVDEIFLAVDKDRKTWSGNMFQIETDFWTWLRDFDKEDKVRIYEDNFYISGMSAIELDTRERTMLSKRMGDCDWYIQIDADEYFLDFSSFLQRLDLLRTKERVTVNCRVAPLFKLTPKGFLLIDTVSETLPFATNYPQYTSARFTLENKIVFFDDIVLHQSWARSSEEIKMKLNSWGHKSDFNTDSYYKLWEAVDENNYIYLKDFHPLDRTTWSKLILMEDKSIIEMMEMKEELNKIYNKGYPIDVTRRTEKKRKPFYRFW